SVLVEGVRLVWGREQPAPRSLLVLTNHAGAEETGLDEELSRVLDGAPVTVLGPRELGAALDAPPRLRLRLPFVLGVRDLGGLIGEEVARRSTADVEAARRLARVFVPTRAYARALDVLERHRFAVLTGPPEMGKTAIARMVAVAAMTAGWEG